MNERSIDLLEAELLEEKNKLDAESRDHTGAVREHLLHKHLDKIIAENVNALRAEGKDMPTPISLSEAKILPGAVEMNRGIIFTSVPKKEH